MSPTREYASMSGESAMTGFCVGCSTLPGETPVVGSAIGGIPEVVVDGETGFLVPLQQIQEPPYAPVSPLKFARDLAAPINRLMADRGMSQEGVTLTTGTGFVGATEVICIGDTINGFVPGTACLPCPSDNQPPQADTGPDQTVQELMLVTLDGSGGGTSF